MAPIKQLAAANPMMTLLHQLLPATTGRPMPTTQLDDFVMLRNMGGEPSVLILKHPELDPALMSWLDGVEKQYAKISDEDTRADAVFQHVRKTFFRSRHSFLCFPSAIRYLRWKKIEAIRVGSFIRRGIGSCLPQAAALQLAYQAVEISSELVMGNSKEICLDPNIYGEVVGSELHAWVERSTGKQLFFDDPMQNLQFRIRNTDPQATRSTTRKLGGVGETRLSFKPIRESYIIGVQHYLSQEDLDNENTMFRQALLLT